MALASTPPRAAVEALGGFGIVGALDQEPAILGPDHPELTISWCHLVNRLVTSTMEDAQLGASSRGASRITDSRRRWDHGW